MQNPAFEGQLTESKGQHVFTSLTHGKGRGYVILRDHHLKGVLSLGR